MEAKAEVTGRHRRRSEETKVKYGMKDDKGGSTIAIVIRYRH